jgi:hypothetical protein
MIVNRNSWHFKLYNWFNEGKLPVFIDLCSYVRTVMFWAPLKAIFYSPAVWLYRRDKLYFYSTTASLIVIINILLIFITHSWVASYLFIIGLIIVVPLIDRNKRIIAADWKEAKNTKFVQYTEKTQKAIETGLKYSVVLPFKTVFWTMWVKMYSFHKALFWSIFAIVAGAICLWLVLIGVWWKVLLTIGGVISGTLIVVGIVFLVEWIKDRKAGLTNNIIWQFLKAQKQKICPSIELRD